MSFGGSKKKKTKSHEYWYELLSAEQVRTLVLAAKLPAAGSKKKQIERLMACESTETYGWDRPKSIACIVSYLKAKCKEANLRASGSKYELVLRLVEHHHQDDKDKNSPKNKRGASDDEKENADNSLPNKKAKLALAD
ncbi:unknown protein [Seminavis robusta]|uniref:SAP domain-containing protein n=1 Tax=Seminavis robusta TaxID=568900 RepID=A0A9N8DBG7_9STRA|nr:unknown protein [Seminavis robusta]|eukprot:Sro24_g016430.1 n/a (138) ;mRNA; f:75098-75511